MKPDINGMITLGLAVAAVVLVSVFAPESREYLLMVLAAIGLTRPRGIVQGK